MVVAEAEEVEEEEEQEAEERMILKEHVALDAFEEPIACGVQNRPANDKKEERCCILS